MQSPLHCARLQPAAQNRATRASHERTRAGNNQETTTCHTRVDVRCSLPRPRATCPRPRSETQLPSTSSYFLPLALAAGAAAAAFFLGAFLLLRGPAPFSFFAVVAFTAGLV